MSPLVASVYRRIVELIERRQIATGEGLPSERRLASELDVSRGVVRAAIRKLVEDGLVESKANCRPVVASPSKRATSRKRHLSVWLWPNTSHYAAASILKGIQQFDFRKETRLVVGTAAHGDWETIYDSERRFLESLLEEPTEACAIMWYLGGERNLDALREVQRAGVSLVFVDRLPPKEITGHFVGTNNEAAAEQAVKHLIGLGHRRIGLLTNVDAVSSVEARQRGYQKALAAAGIHPSPDWVHKVQVDEMKGVQDALDTLLGLAEPPTAFFCINDNLALQVHDELTRREVRIPSDASVVGFDGLLRWVPGGGYLTTMCQDFERIGYVAAELAESSIDAGVAEPSRHFFFDAHFLNAGSTGLSIANQDKQRCLISGT